MKNQLKYNIGIILIAAILICCVPVKKLRNKKLLNQAKEQCSKCMLSFSSEVIDSTIIDGKSVCVFSNGKLKSTGEIGYRDKIGNWYYYDDNCSVNYIIKYFDSKKDSIYLYRAYTVNESW